MILERYTTKVGMLLLAAVVAMSAPAGAATIVQTDSEITGRIGFSRFDPGLGVLNSARLEVAAYSQRLLLVLPRDGLAEEPVPISWQIDGVFDVSSDDLRLAVPITGSGLDFVDLSSGEVAFVDTYASGNAAFELSPEFVSGPSSDMSRFFFFNADYGFFDPTLDTSVEAPDTVNVLTLAGGCGLGNGTTFCSDARLTLTYDYTPLSAVPEPTTWAMMIGGFGMVGGAMRSARRRQKVGVSYA